MTKKEILKSNKLIAEFMECYRETDDSNEEFYSGYWLEEISKTSIPIYSDELLFHKSWDWLMPVVDKIFKMPEYYKYKDNLSIFASGIILLPSRIDRAYEEVIDFIKYYNNNPVA